MNKQELIFDKLLEQKLLPLFYHSSAEVSISILRALYDAGVRLIEYTNRGEHALANFTRLKEAVVSGMPGMLLGIGTIKNKAQAEAYINAGADFIVCPSVNEEVGRVTKEAGLLWIPGCMTPTEIAVAENNGAKLVKIFPGNILGPAYISSIKDLFPDMIFMPTGGVEIDRDNLAAWFNAGVVAVGMGSKLITKQLVDSNNYEGIKELTLKAVGLIKTITN